MKLRRLLDTFHRGYFRENLAKQSALIKQNERFPSMALGEHSCKLISHPLARDLVNLRRELLNRHKCFGLNCVRKTRCKSDSPEHSQPIFRKAKFGVSNRAHNACF